MIENSNALKTRIFETSDDSDGPRFEQLERPQVRDQGFQDRARFKLENLRKKCFFFLFLWPYTSFNFNVTGNSIVCIDRGTEYFLWEPCRLKVNFTFYFFSSLNSTFPRCRGRVVFSARTFFFLLLLFFFFIGTRARATTPAQA